MGPIRHAGYGDAMSTPRSLELPAGAHRSTVDTSRGPFAAIEWLPPAAGPTRTPVLLLPGYTGSKEDFIGVVAPIGAAGHRAVAVDLRGQYETLGSDQPDTYELAQLGADVVALVTAIGGRAHLVGHSFGGLVARAAVRLAVDQHAVELTSLTLLGSGPSPVTGQASLTNLSLLSAALPVHDLETIWTAKRALELTGGEPEVGPEVEAFLHERFVRTHPVGLAVAAAQLLETADQIDELARVGLPVLVLYGETEDVWDPADLAAMAARIGARSHVVSGAGHSPAVDSPAATAAAMVSFWRTIEV